MLLRKTQTFRSHLQIYFTRICRKKLFLTFYGQNCQCFRKFWPNKGQDEATLSLSPTLNKNVIHFFNDYFDLI